MSSSTLGPKWLSAHAVAIYALDINKPQHKAPLLSINPWSTYNQHLRHLEFLPIMVTRSVPAKRKQAADMPESPPKRVTRARAAKAPEAEQVKAPTAKTKSSAATKSSSTTRKTPAAASIRTARSKTVVKDVSATLNQDEQNDAIEADAGSKPKTTTRSKQIKATEESDIADGPAATKKSRGRQKKAVAEVADQPEAPKTRGKSTKAAVPASKGEPAQETQTVEVETVEPVEPVKRTTARKAPAKAGVRATRGTTASRSTTGKKKVQFEDEHDKENIPITTKAAKKGETKATGVKAKPLRRPPVAVTTTRSRKAAKTSNNGEEASKDRTMPLSPKKVNQVAKTPSSSEDELATHEKTPIKSLSKSPLKIQMSPTRAPHSPSKPVAFSPMKQLSASVLASPAKRPPQSPFKDSMKSPAKKFDLEGPSFKPALTTSSSQTPFKTSLLQISPKKVRIANKEEKNVFSTSQSPFKGSLLQSPARRPLGSPLKAIALTPKLPPSHVEEKGQDSATTPSYGPGNVTSDANAGSQASEQPVTFQQPEPAAMNTVSEQEIPSSPEVDLDSTASSLHHIIDIKANNTEEGPLDLPRIAEQGHGIGISPRGEASLSDMAFRRISTYSQLSEDELASPDKKYAPTPLKRNGAENSDDTGFAKWDTSSMTPLADKFSCWTTSSPEGQRPSRYQRGIFSLPAISSEKEESGTQLAEVLQPAPDATSKSSFFEDDFAMLDAEPMLDREVGDPDSPSVDNLAGLAISMESNASEEYGDENALPSEAEMLRADQDGTDPTLTITPAKVFTPAKPGTHQTREVYTVSKVPLRPSAEDSPLKLPRQRSKSFGGALAVLADNSSGQEELPDQPLTPQLAPIAVPQTPSTGMKLDLDTPGRTNGKSRPSDVLKGAVVYVDVHTTEGADASGIFIELLNQMGARCVKQWHWNPRSSLGDDLEGTESPDSTPAAVSSTPTASKIGITHVVYKDGGVRTLEKVRLSKGVVTCVGVGWVLE